MLDFELTWSPTLFILRPKEDFAAKKWELVERLAEPCLEFLEDRLESHAWLER